MAYKDIDTLLCADFHKMMRGRKCLLARNQNFQIPRLPIPKLSTLSPETGCQRAVIKGVKEDYFSTLNTKHVLVLPRNGLVKRQVDVDGVSFKAVNGKIVTVPVTVPNGCTAVMSTCNIALPNAVENSLGKKVLYKPAKEYKYVDYIDKQGELRQYIYIVPKSCVYSLNSCALVITANRRKVYYKGYRVALQNGDNVYLFVVPYKNKASYCDYRVIGLKEGINFNSEVERIIRFWMKLGVTFNLHLTNVELNDYDIKNIAFEELTGTLLSDDYSPYSDISLGESDSESFQDYE